ncbi:MAG: dihydrolipoyl dehydrogenase [Eubacteriales bacterium]
MSNNLDVAVLGGGPGGYSAAIRLAQLGAKVVLFEQKYIGGTCLNVGCIPTKSLLEKAGLIDKIRENKISGLLKDAGLYSWKKIQQEKNNTIKTLVKGVENILQSYDIKVIHEGVKLTADKKMITINSAIEYEAEQVIIATGSETFIPPIPGVDGSHVITSTEALSFEKIPKSILIIGGGVIGVEIASIYASFGTKVTIVEMLDSILNSEDQETVRFMHRKLKNNKIDIFVNTKVINITDKDHLKNIHCEEILSHKNLEFKAEYVLVAVGRKANLDLIDVDGLGLNLDNGYIIVDDCLKTDIEGIYAVGDVTGKFLLAHSAYEQGICAAENIMGKMKKINITNMPRCIYTHPQLAAIGFTEESLMKSGRQYKKVVFPFAANGKAIAMKEKGFVKMLVDDTTDEILGVHMIGNGTTELLSSALIAMNGGIKAKQLGEMIFPHPTLSEMVKESALMVHHEAIHIPKSMK